MQTAWNYLNDSLRTNVYLKYEPEIIACSCLHLSARLLQIPLPDKPAWYLLFDASEEDVNDVCLSILYLYTRKKPDPVKLLKIVEDLRKSRMDDRLKSKESALSSNSPKSSPSSLSSGSSRTESANSETEKDCCDTKLDISSRCHGKLRNPSPLDDKCRGSEPKRRKTTSSGYVSGRSSSPKRKTRTPISGIKDSHRSRSSNKRESNGRKHHRSPVYLPSQHSSKNAYKSKYYSKKSHSSRSRDRYHHSNKSFHGSSYRCKHSHSPSRHYSKKSYKNKHSSVKRQRSHS